MRVTSSNIFIGCVKKSSLYLFLNVDFYSGFRQCWVFFGTPCIFWGDFKIFVQNMRVIVAPAEAKITPKSQFLAFLPVLLMF